MSRRCSVAQVEESHVGAYWGDRRESLDGAAARLSGFLHELSAIDEAYARWYDAGDSAGSTSPIDTTPGGLGGRLESFRTDVGDEIVPALGWRFGSWDGGRLGLTISATLGLWAGREGLGNSVVVTYPSLDGEEARIFQRERAVQVVQALVCAFEPDHVRWATYAMYEFQPYETAAQPVIGWMTYIKGAEPATSGVESVELEEGTVLIAASSIDSAGEDEVRSARLRFAGIAGL